MDIFNITLINEPDSIPIKALAGIMDAQNLVIKLEYIPCITYIKKMI